MISKIDWGEKRGYGEIGIENWWHLIGLKRTHNRDSAGREKGRLVRRVIRCLVWWNSLFISFTLLGIPNVHLELSQQELVLKWESLLKNPLTESGLLKNNLFTDSSHFSGMRALRSMPWNELISSSTHWLTSELNVVVLDWWFINPWLLSNTNSIFIDSLYLTTKISKSYG